MHCRSVKERYLTREFVEELKSTGYDVIISIGDTRENEIGSNCGMYVLKFLKERNEMDYAYKFANKLSLFSVQ